MPKTQRRWFGLRALSQDHSPQSTINGWSSWPGETVDRVREASRNLPSLKDVRIPDVKLPEVRVPDVNLKDMRLPQLRRRQPWYQRVAPTAAVAGIAVAGGAAVAYFLDPERGRARRAQTIDRLAGFTRRTADSAARAGRKLSSDAGGWTNMVVSLPARRIREPLDDATLAHKVESELFRDKDIEKGKININAENGVIVVRGEAPMDVARQIEFRVRRIDGVKEVHNLLHEATEKRTEATESTPTEQTPTEQPATGV
jgi:hypothetical protein